MVRRKPTPTDRKSLPQIYHRWLYQDGAALWHTLSVAQKEQWELDARPFRITGFNYWIRTYLTTLPDLMAGYHLDNLSPTTAIDFSKNANDGVIYGALPTKGIIQNALLFDGVDDYISIPDSPSLVTGFKQTFTIEFFIYLNSAPPTLAYIIWKYWPGFLLRLWANRKIEFWLWEPGASHSNISTLTIPLQSWTIIHIQRDFANHQTSHYINNVHAGTVVDATAELDSTGKILYIVKPFTYDWLNTTLDHITIYNRLLTASDRQRHLERRYPL